MQQAEARSDEVEKSPYEGERSASAPLCKRTNQPEQIADLYDGHAAKDFHYLLVLVGDRTEAEDALHAVFLELVGRPEVLTGVHSPRTYLLTMARNWVFRSRQRVARQHAAERKAGEARLLKANDPGAFDAEDTAQLEKAIMTLPEEQREVFVLKAFERLTFREIAAVMGISENTAASRYRYALEKLRESYNARPGS